MSPTTPLPQSVAGDAAAFGPGLVAATTNEVRFDLKRPAYVTVLRVWQTESGLPVGLRSNVFGWMELIYPFDPQRQTFAQGPASHQIRFQPGQRRLALPVPQASAKVTEFTRPENTESGTSRACQMAQQANATRRNAPALVPCVVRVPLTTTRWTLRPAPEQLGPHRLLVIVSAARVDLATLSRTVDSLDADIDAFPQFAAALLTAHRGRWAAYVVRVD